MDKVSDTTMIIDIDYIISSNTNRISGHGWPLIRGVQILVWGEQRSAALELRVPYPLSIVNR